MAVTAVFLISALRAVVELIALCLLGQGILYMLAGRTRHSNPIYRLFDLLTRPALALLRTVIPRLITDQHLPTVGFFLLLWLWLALALARRLICAESGPVCL